ncbi:OLC1v1008914C1 [Oldenlandia corymbosa var. corymbosa]|uniref:Ubiquitin carboxyl-terminal hydrolase n=1 Tax=Oldenlandia corymbosa var. corymbosa TaxID=529605 RepID=A0AAV1DN07_OLDCO|nr:OLC1v1008914C1 [Oldenlandia corymbosa var. corymbosa]
MKVEGVTDFNPIVQGLKLGGRTRFPQSGLRLLSLAGSLIGAIGLIFAVKDGKVRDFVNFGLPWLSDDRAASDKRWVVSGLQNLGNNCFLNVILQALASCSSFKKFLEEIIEEYESGIGRVEENPKTLPLADALASLLEELSAVHNEVSVLNPRKVMTAMDHYVPRFNLTSQQDAEEAFFHLLSSLREELFECYVPNDSSLVDATTSRNFRIISSSTRLKGSEQERWRRSFIGPFDGIIGSSLTCQSCSYQISLDFQLFHSLHLSPVRSCGIAINTGCSLVDCLSKFFASEQLENYFCTHCWHVAAMKYLTVVKNQADTEKLQQCNEDDSCDCKDLPSLRHLPWSNSFSRTFKQLIIARSPQILCIHLQRASVNLYGDSIKLLGHISFPLILDLSRFMKRVKNLAESSHLGETLGEYQPILSCTDHQSLQLDADSKQCNGQTGRWISSGTEISKQQQTAYASSKSVSGIKACSSVLENNTAAEFITDFIPNNLNYKGGEPLSSELSEDQMYRLVSVVQHFGNVGSGHYTVYRRMKAESRDEDPVQLLEPAHVQWFSISDSEVHIVSEKDVLEAEASLLFYEKMV